MRDAIFYMACMVVLAGITAMITIRVIEASSN